MAKQGDDCYYYYTSNCTKGSACHYRHCPEALGCETECTLWKEGMCFRSVCKFRHMEIKKKRPCYWETQPSGCQRANCLFSHIKPRVINGQYIGPSNAPADLQQIYPLAAAAVQKSSSRDNSPPHSRPIVPPILINPDEESDSESLQGSPMKQRCAASRQQDCPKPQAHEQPVLAAKETEELTEEQSLDGKSLEDLRREKVRIAKKLLEDAEKELLECEVVTVPKKTQPPSHERQQTRMPPPTATPAPSKTIKLGRSKETASFVVKSLEDIRRQQALATLNRGNKRKIEPPESLPSYTSTKKTRNNTHDEPARKAVLKSSKEEGTNEPRKLYVMSLEEIHREQALESMFKRRAEKELERIKAEEAKQIEKMASSSSASSSPSRRLSHSSEEEEEEEEEEATITRRVIIASDESTHKKSVSLSAPPALKVQEQVKPKVPVMSRLGGRKITVAPKSSVAAESNIKNRLGSQRDIKARLGVVASVHRLIEVGAAEQESMQARRRSHSSSVTSSDLSAFSDDDDIEEKTKVAKSEEKPSKATSLSPKERPVTTRKITLGGSYNDKVSGKRGLSTATAREEGAAKKQRIVGGRKHVAWGGKSYSEVMREKRLGTVTVSAEATDDKPPVKSAHSRISPIRFDEPTMKRKVRGISPTGFEGHKRQRSSSPSSSVTRRIDTAAALVNGTTSRSVGRDRNSRIDSKPYSRTKSPSKERNRPAVVKTVITFNNESPSISPNHSHSSKSRRPSPISFSSNSHAQHRSDSSNNQEQVSRDTVKVDRKPEPERKPRKISTVWSTRGQQATKAQTVRDRIQYTEKNEEKGPSSFSSSSSSSVRNRIQYKERNEEKGPSSFSSSSSSVRNRIRFTERNEEKSVKPVRKLNLNTSKKVSRDPNPSPTRPAFMRAAPHPEEEYTIESSSPAPVESVIKHTETKSSEQDINLPSSTVTSSSVKSPDVKSPVIKSSPSTSQSTTSSQEMNHSSVSSNTSTKKATNSAPDDLGPETLFLDDDLFDLLNDDTEGANPVTTTVTDDDELLAQMEAFLK